MKTFDIFIVVALMVSPISSFPVNNEEGSDSPLQGDDADQLTRASTKTRTSRWQPSRPIPSNDRYHHQLSPDRRRWTNQHNIEQTITGLYEREKATTTMTSILLPSKTNEYPQVNYIYDHTGGHLKGGPVWHQGATSQHAPTITTISTNSSINWPSTAGQIHRPANYNYHPATIGGQHYRPVSVHQHAPSLNSAHLYQPAIALLVAVPFVLLLAGVAGFFALTQQQQQIQTTVNNNNQLASKKDNKNVAILVFVVEEPALSSTTYDHGQSATKNHTIIRHYVKVVTESQLESLGISLDQLKSYSKNPFSDFYGPENKLTASLASFVGLQLPSDRKYSIKHYVKIVPKSKLESKGILSRNGLASDIPLELEELEAFPELRGILYEPEVEEDPFIASRREDYHQEFNDNNGHHEQLIPFQLEGSASDHNSSLHDSILQRVKMIQVPIASGQNPKGNHNNQLNPAPASGSPDILEITSNFTTYLHELTGGSKNVVEKKPRPAVEISQTITANWPTADVNSAQHHLMAAAPTEVKKGSSSKRPLKEKEPEYLGTLGLRKNLTANYWASPSGIQQSNTSKTTEQIPGNPDSLILPSSGTKFTTWSSSSKPSSNNSTTFISNISNKAPVYLGVLGQTNSKKNVTNNRRPTTPGLNSSGYMRVYDVAQNRPRTTKRNRIPEMNYGSSIDDELSDHQRPTTKPNNNRGRPTNWNSDRGVIIVHQGTTNKPMKDRYSPIHLGTLKGNQRIRNGTTGIKRTRPTRPEENEDGPKKGEDETLTERPVAPDGWEKILESLGALEMLLQNVTAVNIIPSPIITARLDSQVSEENARVTRNNPDDSNVTQDDDLPDSRKKGTTERPGITVRRRNRPGALIEDGE